VPSTSIPVPQSATVRCRTVTFDPPPVATATPTVSLLPEPETAWPPPSSVTSLAVISMQVAASPPTSPVSVYDPDWSMVVQSSIPDGSSTVTVVCAVSSFRPASTTVTVAS